MQQTKVTTQLPEMAWRMFSSSFSRELIILFLFSFPALVPCLLLGLEPTLGPAGQAARGNGRIHFSCT